MSHNKLYHLATSKFLELFHMDLMGPIQVESLGGERYCVDDFLRYTRVKFIREKTDTFDVFKDLCLSIKNEKRSEIVKIKSDRGKEFENSKLSKKILYLRDQS